MATKKYTQGKIGDLQRTPLNLIQAECYSRHPHVLTGLDKPNESPQKYYELRTIETSDGFVEKLVEVDYPITREYVNSFAESADYHSDIAAAMAAPAPGPNLGDLTSIQDLLAMDMQSLRTLKQKIDIVEKEKAAKAAPVASAVSATEGENNG